MATAASAFSDMVFRVNSAGDAFSFALWHVWVPHIATVCATRCGSGMPVSCGLIVPTPRLASVVVGVGHKPDTISSMGRIDGTSRNNDRPAGVADAFQVSRHSVEPILANRCRNLFSHDDRGPTGSNEAEEDGPEVALVRLALLLTGGAERLAGGASGPQGPVIWPPGEASSVSPAAKSSEEVALGEAPEVIGGNIDN